MPSSKHPDGNPSRPLPKRRNHLLAADKTPELPELISMRRLGRTDLSVRPAQVGTINATKPEHLGPFDYAHLRAPLPDDLKSSQIFAPQPNQSPPTSYFLMRRSNDGFVSATGMFKAAFPWAKHTDEEAEKDYVKSQSTTSQDEIAGNLWVSEHFAIELADEYGIASWIQALLDPTPISIAGDDPKTKDISPPPKFKFTAGDKSHFAQPNGTPARGTRATTPKTRGRPRAGSPEKKAGSPQKSSRKPRSSKAVKEANAVTAKEASDTLQTALNDAASVVDGDSNAADDTAKIDVETTIEHRGDVSKETTNVTFEMPKGVPELPLPESPETMIEKAKEIVVEAQKLDGVGQSRSKRKAEQLDDELDETSDGDIPPAKRAKLLQQEVRLQKMRYRGLIGVAAGIFVGVAVPFLAG